MTKYLVPLHSADHLAGDALEVEADSPEEATTATVAEVKLGKKGKLPGAKGWVIEAPVEVDEFHVPLEVESQDLVGDGDKVPKGVTPPTT